jgi:hypothetical protein
LAAETERTWLWAERPETAVLKTEDIARPILQRHLLKGHNTDPGEILQLFVIIVFLAIILDINRALTIIRRCLPPIFKANPGDWQNRQR